MLLCLVLKVSSSTVVNPREQPAQTFPPVFDDDVVEQQTLQLPRRSKRLSRKNSSSPIVEESLSSESLLCSESL